MGWSQLFFEIHVPPKDLQQVQLSNARGGQGDNLNFTTLTTELALGLGVFLDPKPSKGLMILKHSAMLIAWQNNVILPMKNCSVN